MLGLVVLLWLVEATDAVLRMAGYTLDGLGIRPDDWWGLLYILTAPWLHIDWAHLTTNSVSLLILGTLSQWSSRRQHAWTVAAAVLLGGAFTWAVAPPGAVHIGSSGICFALMALLIGNGVFRRRFAAILIAVVVTVLFGGTLYFALPTETAAAERISWQMHLGGFISGLLVSWKTRKQAP